MFPKHSTVFYTPGNANDGVNVRARVLVVHNDGSYTIKALFYVNADGSDKFGYLGYTYRRVTGAKLRATL